MMRDCFIIPVILFVLDDEGLFIIPVILFVLDDEGLFYQSCNPICSR